MNGRREEGEETSDGVYEYQEEKKWDAKEEKEEKKAKHEEKRWRYGQDI